MTGEYAALLANHTWDLVLRPAGTNIVTGKWVYATSSDQMVHYSDTRLDGYFEGSHNVLVLTLQKLSALWSSPLRFRQYSLLLSHVIGL